MGKKSKSKKETYLDSLGYNCSFSHFPYVSPQKSSESSTFFSLKIPSFCLSLLLSPPSPILQCMLFISLPYDEKKKISFLSFSFLFFNLPIQKQSSQFQIPLQNLPRNVPLSLNSNGKFPYKNMKFFEIK